MTRAETPVLSHRHRPPGRRPGSLHRVAAWAARVAIALLGRLPLGVSQRLGMAIGYLAAWLPTTTRRRILTNLRLCFPNWSESERRRLMRRNLAHTVCTILEWPALLCWSRPRILGMIQGVTGEELISGPLASGRGVIMAAIHMSAWELLGIACAGRYPMTALYRPLRIGGLELFTQRSRKRFGGSLVPGDFAGLRAMGRALRRGEVAWIMPDQDPGRGQGVFAPLFGIPANTGTLVSKLARRTGAAVVFANVERLGPGRGFRLHFTSGSPDVLSEDVTTAAGALNAQIQRLIAANPEQYLWRYRRFRNTPM